MKTSNALHIFKAGKQIAANGLSLSFTEKDLAASAAAYDPAIHEAPIVVGHPKADAPAYGWVQSLRSEGGELFAEPQQVNADFAELVKAGSFKKISASFYTPDSPTNPVPGVYYLRHVGFLGAEPPAIKGLKQIEFSEADEGVVEFSDWEGVVNANMWRQLRDWLIGKFGLEEADKAIASWNATDLQIAAAQPEQEPAGAMPLAASFSEQPTEETTVTPEELAALKNENLALKAKLDEQEKKQRVASFSEFITALVAEGKVLPVEQANILCFAESLSVETTVEFSEGDNKTQHNHLEAFKQLLSARPVVVNFAEVAKSIPTNNGIDLSDPQAIKAAAEQLQKEAEAKGETLNYAEAVSQVCSAE